MFSPTVMAVLVPPREDKIDSGGRLEHGSVEGGTSDTEASFEDSNPGVYGQAQCSSGLGCRAASAPQDDPVFAQQRDAGENPAHSDGSRTH